MFLDSKGERKVIKNKIIKVQDILITVASEDFDDYICITDMAAAKGGDSRAADVIRNWLRNRMTLEFLCTWEEIYNPEFKVSREDVEDLMVKVEKFGMVTKDVCERRIKEYEGLAKTEKKRR